MGSNPTKTQVSAGGVVFREVDGGFQVALISVGEDGRWQLPKGTPGRDESTEQTALREVREETGLQSELVQPLDKIEYWFYVRGKTRPVRIHKHVYFFLLRYLGGDTRNHDHEVNEARWVDLEQAEAMLAFESEKKVLATARQILLAEDDS
jgi:8-oxo-dGTP pyrophosphatase MutT (NUDIX family)